MKKIKIFLIGLFLFVSSIYSQSLSTDSLGHSTTDSIETISLDTISNINEQDIVNIKNTKKKLTYSDSLELKAKRLKIPKMNNKAFSVGEELNFVIYLDFIFNWTAGYTKMMVLDTVYFHGRPAYHIKVTTKSTKFIAHFYTIRDTIESYIDMEYGFSWGYKKRTREGKYNRDLVVEYDHLHDKALVEYIRYDSENIEKVKKEKSYYTDIIPFTNDILSSFYVMRTRDIAVDKNLKIQNHSQKLNYVLDVDIIKKSRIEVEDKKYDAFRVKPKTKGENIIDTKNDMYVYITRDSSHMPIRMTTDLALGSIKVELYKIRQKKFTKDKDDEKSPEDDD